jgi:hypothetical protein
MQALYRAPAMQRATTTIIRTTISTTRAGIKAVGRTGTTARRPGSVRRLSPGACWVQSRPMCTAIPFTSPLRRRPPVRRSTTHSP